MVARAACGRAGWRRNSAPGSRWPRSATSAALASTSAVSRRSFSCTPPNSAKTLTIPPGFGWTVGERNFNWSTLIANKDREIARLNGVYEKILLDNGVRILRARATIADAHTVVVGSERFTARYILVATGGWPTTPSIPGGELAITSNEAFFLPQFPARVIVVGGGYIGLEFAGIFHGLGAKVTVVHRGELFLRGFDDDVRRALAVEMDKRGIELRFNSKVERIEEHTRGIRATLNDGATLEADLIMFATGRTPNTHDLGLERAGVMLDQEGAVVVDPYSLLVGGEYLRGRRLHRSHAAHAGGDRRGAGRGRDPISRKSENSRLRKRADRGVQPAPYRHRGADGGRGARALSRGRYLQVELPAAETYAQRPRRTHVS